MLAGLNVEAVTLAGAFCVGLVLGAVATIRLTRAIIDSLRRARRRLEDDETDT